MIRSILVGGWATPLKNMSSSSIGMIIPNIWEIFKNGNQTTNQNLFTILHWICNLHRPLSHLIFNRTIDYDPFQEPWPSSQDGTQKALETTGENINPLWIAILQYQ